MINYDNFLINLHTIQYLNKDSALNKMIALFKKFISIFFVAVFFICNKIISFALISLIFGINGLSESFFIISLHELAIFMVLIVPFVKLLLKVILLLVISKWFIKIQTNFVYCRENVAKVDISSKNTKVQFYACPVNQKYNS